MAMRLLNFLGKQIAMDLGTANTLMYLNGEIVLDEPSVVALDARTSEVLAVGRSAKEFLGRTPQRIRCVRPLKNGVIADFDVTRVMIAHFVRMVIKGFHLVGPSMVICVPTGITQVEKRAVIDAAKLVGAREVALIEEPMAAAIGAGMPITEPLGNLIVDIGGGTSEVALITLSAIACSKSVRIAGDAMTLSIQRYLQGVFKLVIGENMAERIKLIAGSAIPLEEPIIVEVSGKDFVTGMPKLVRVTDTHIREALQENVRTIVSTVLSVLEQAPPELASDIYRNGLLLAGGGAMLKGLAQRIAQETRLKVLVDDEPLTAVLRGAGAVLEDRLTYQSVIIN